MGLALIDFTDRYLAIWDCYQTGFIVTLGKSRHSEMAQIMTNPPYGINEAYEAAERTIATTRDEVRRYIPEVVRRMMMTFGAPLLVAVLVATIGAMLLARVLPSPTVSLIAFVVNVGVMFYGWRYFEQRLHGTSAFVVYTRYSRLRRDLETLLKQAPEGADVSAADIEEQRELVVEAADAFIDVMQDMGAQPTSNR